MNEADFFQSLESSPLAVYIRHSYVLYPVIEILHIIGFIFLAGSAFLFDFRLLGVSKKIPVTDLARHLLPWARRSLFLVIPSGILLFITQATSLSTNNVFKLKLLLIILALANAAYFHRFTFRTVNAWNTGQAPSAAAKAAGIISLLVWTGVITCGRFLAYFE